ncbi:MAG TPA: cysteine hydrolase [Gaiellaceae bacterium]|nr:cysteine hydrolase [Gaiellaceae bacterium]
MNRLIPSQSALLNVDLQHHFVESARDGHAVVRKINILSAAFRDAGALVVHTRHVLRPDGSNIGLLRRIPKIRDGVLNEGAPSAAFHQMLEIDDRDVRLDKPRFGAFHATDLELILRSRGIDTIVLTGISTPVCCDTTAREANARDFEVLIVRDATTSTGEDPDRYRDQSLDILDGLLARVVTSDEILQALESEKPRH